MSLWSIKRISIAHKWPNNTLMQVEFYFAGIYDEPACNPNNLSHAVLLVGYGSEGGQDYWIIKNRSELYTERLVWHCIELHFLFIPHVKEFLFYQSLFFLFSWGSSWGEGGYMRLVRDGRNTCGIASYSLYPIIWVWWDDFLQMWNFSTGLSRFNVCNSWWTFLTLCFSQGRGTHTNLYVDL